MTTPADRPAAARRPGRLRIVDLARPHRIALTIALLAVLGETAADVLEPWPVKIVIDSVLQAKPLPNRLGRVAALFGHSPTAILVAALAAVLLIAAAGAVSAYVEKYTTTSISQWVAHDLRLMLYNHVQRLSLADHGRARTGDLLGRVTSDIDAVQDFIGSALVGGLVDVLTLAGMVAVMFAVDWRFALLALSIAPVLMTLVLAYSRRIKTVSRAVRKQESELMAGLADVLASIRVVQAFAREDYEERRFEWESRHSAEAGLEARSVKAKLTPMIDVIAALGTCIVLGYGTRVALEGRISVGVLLVFLFYLEKTYKPLRDLSKMANTISKAAIGYERIREVLEIESRVRDLPGARPAPPFAGAVELDHVTFGYGDEPVLKDVSLRIRPGQVAAIVGPSGAGKTTIAGLIARFYDPQAGAVRIDGTDIRAYTLKSLRDQMSFVLQDTILFRGTIWENIAYGRPDAPPEETVRAAMLANAHDFIMTLPHGYATMVGERGATLSGGQRQRIAIARAIVRDTPLLILDEPTVGLDAASEQAVIDALGRLMEGRTTIVVAHHFATIRRADLIFVVKDGGLAEAGTHGELMARGGVYADLQQIQTGGA